MSMIAHDPQRPLVYVYGTLKKGFDPHKQYLWDSDFMGDSKYLKGIMFHVGGFPAIHLYEKGVAITGEVYKVRDLATITALDRYEGVNTGFFQREQVEIPEFGKVWVYTQSREEVDHYQWYVPDGNWRGPLSPKMFFSGFDAYDNKERPILTLSAPVSVPVKPIIQTVAAPKVRWSMLKDKPGYAELFEVESGKNIGTYRIRGEITGTDGKVKPLLMIPTSKPDSHKTVVDARGKVWYKANFTQQRKIHRISIAGPGVVNAGL